MASTSSSGSFRWRCSASEISSSQAAAMCIATVLGLHGLVDEEEACTEEAPEVSEGVWCKGSSFFTAIVTQVDSHSSGSQSISLSRAM